MTNLVSNIETIDEIEYEIFETLLTVITKHQCDIDIKLLHNGDREFYVMNDDIKHLCFLNVSHCNNFIYFNKQNASNIIRHLKKYKNNIIYDDI
jgi:hypothetical protein